MKKYNIRISGKRQLTIPKEFFEKLGFVKKAECYISEDMELIVKPKNEYQWDNYFAAQILKELIDDGYQGNELLTAFQEKTNKVSLAIVSMIEEAQDSSNNPDKYSSYSDIKQI